MIEIGGLVGGYGEFSEKERKNLLDSHKNRGEIKKIVNEDCFLAKFSLRKREALKNPIEVSENRFLVFDGNIFYNEESEIIEFLKKGDFPKLYEMNIEFAFIFLDKNKENIYLGRDVVGSRPLFFSETNDGVVVGSEKHELLLNGYVDVKRVEPGSLVRIDLVTKEATTKRLSGFDVQERDLRRIDELKQDFLNKFRDSIKKRTKGVDEAAVAFSGGVDSSFLSKMLSRETDIKLFTVGLKDSHDIVWSKKASSILDLPHKVIEISFEGIKELIEPTLKIVAEANRLKLGVGLPFYVLSKEVNEEGFDILFSGQGSDELFLGYDKYRRSGDPKQKIIKDLERMAEENIERDEAICMENGVEIRNPYLDQNIIDFALSLPYEINLPEKRVVREAAKMILPKSIWKRAKKSVQYGTKVDREIDRIARRDGYKRKIGNHVDKYLSQVVSEIFPREALEEVTEHLNH